MQLLSYVIEKLIQIAGNVRFLKVVDKKNDLYFQMVCFLIRYHFFNI